MKYLLVLAALVAAAPISCSGVSITKNDLLKAGSNCGEVAVLTAAPCLTACSTKPEAGPCAPDCRKECALGCAEGLLHSFAPACGQGFADLASNQLGEAVAAAVVAVGDIVDSIKSWEVGSSTLKSALLMCGRALVSTGLQCWSTCAGTLTEECAKACGESVFTEVTPTCAKSFAELGGQEFGDAIGDLAVATVDIYKAAMCLSHGVHCLPVP